MNHAIHGGAYWQPRIRTAADYAGIVAADVNDAWYPPAPEVLEAVAAWAPHANHSPDTSGRALVEAIAECFTVPVEVIRLGGGSSDLLHHLIAALAGPGDEVLTLDPTYAEYARVARLCGAGVRTVPLDPAEGFAADPRAIINAVHPGTRLVVLCNPNNPTGGVIARADLLNIAAALPVETFLLVDEAYIDFASTESIFADAPALPQVAVVRTFSKAFAMAGLRVGYAALGERVAERFDARGRPPWPVSLIGLHAAIAALAPEARCYVEQRIAETARLKQSLLDRLALPAVPAATHFFLIDAGNPVDDLLARLRARGIFLRGLDGFTDRQFTGYVRITTQSEARNSRIVSAIREDQ